MIQNNRLNKYIKKQIMIESIVDKVLDYVANIVKDKNRDRIESELEKHNPDLKDAILDLNISAQRIQNIIQKEFDTKNKPDLSN